MKDFKKLIREAHLGNPLNEIDRATRVDRIFAGDIEIPEFDPEDVKADLAREEDDEINEENEKYDHIARAEYGKPFSLLSIAQKQEMLSYMNRETEKEFETDFERRRKGDYSDDRDDGMTDYQRRRMDEALDPKDFPANFFYGGKIYVFDRIAGGDRAVYYNPKYKGDKLVFGSRKQMEDYLDDYVEPKGGTQSSHFGTNENINDPVLMKTRAAQMKRASQDKRNAMDSKRISADEAIDLRYELSILNKEREDILMRIEDIGVEMEQTSEPEGGPIADKLGERLMAADKELRAVNNKIIDIKDDLGDFDMNESVNEEKDYSKMHNVELNATYKKKFGVKDTKGLTRDELIKKLNDADLSEGNGGAKQDDEINLNVSNANDIADEEEAHSGVLELRNKLKENLVNRLK